MFVFLGNRGGSPPSGSGGGNEGQDENNTSDDEKDEEETVQTGLGGAAAAAGAAAGAAASAAAGSGVAPPVDGDIPDGDENDGDDAEGDTPEDDELSEEEPAVPDQEPPELPEEPDDVPSGGDDYDHPEPVEDREDCEEPETDVEEEDAPEDEDDLDDEDEEPRFVYGDIVYDRDCTNRDDVDESELDRMVVVNVTGVNAHKWECNEDETVADRNPHYPPTDDVIVVVAHDVLDSQVPLWDEREEDISMDELVAADIPYSEYPSLRLELDEPSHLRDPFYSI